MDNLYKLDFPNGKSYVGITTKTIDHRFRAHCCNAKTGRRAMLYAAWRKYGEPTLKVLAIVEDRDLAETEVRAVAVFKTLTPNGYNMTPGGDCSPMLTKESVTKMLNAKRANGSFGRLTEEGRKRLSNAHKGNKHGLGYKHTEEWKLAASERLKENKHASGTTISQERRDAMSKRSKGNKIMLGRKLSDETKAKMSVSQQARRAKEKKS